MRFSGIEWITYLTLILLGIRAKTQLWTKTQCLVIIFLWWCEWIRIVIIYFAGGRMWPLLWWNSNLNIKGLCMWLPRFLLDIFYWIISNSFFWKSHFHLWPGPDCPNYYDFENLDVHVMQGVWSCYPILVQYNCSMALDTAMASWPIWSKMS